MSPPSDSDKHDRLVELLCDRALVGLSSEEEVELVTLLPSAAMDPDFEMAAAALQLSTLDVRKPLPARVRDKLMASLPSTGGPTLMSTPPQPTDPDSAFDLNQTLLLPQRTAQALHVPLAPTQPPLQRTVETLPTVAKAGEVSQLPARQSSRSSYGWFAAAACLLVAAASVLQTRPWVDRSATAPARRALIQLPNVAMPQPSVAEKRTRLIDEATDVVRHNWSPTSDPAGKIASGEVVWSNARQEGYMTFRSLEPNDPKASQYQLWIFDSARDKRYPVDGGVFDVPAGGGEVVIPISAKVAVFDPTLFAVTVERPGGVVVSKRERIVVAAKVSG